MERDARTGAADSSRAAAFVTGVGALFDRFIGALERRRYADARAVRAQIEAGRNDLRDIGGRLEAEDVAATLSFLAQLEHLLDVLDDALLATPMAERERRLEVLHRSLAASAAEARTD
jgi:hypothetical protein